MLNPSGLAIVDCMVQLVSSHQHRFSSFTFGTGDLVKIPLFLILLVCGPLDTAISVYKAHPYIDESCSLCSPITENLDLQWRKTGQEVRGSR